MAHAKPRKLGKTRRAPRRSSAKGLKGTSAVAKGWGAKYRIAIDVPTFDPVALVDHLSDVHMAETWHAIGEGRRADGSGPQPELASFGRAGRMAAEGQRPDVRGYTGLTSRPFRDHIYREAIKVSGRVIRRSRVVQGVRALAGQAFLVTDSVQGTRARTKIRPDKRHRGWLALEASKRSVAYFFTGGFMGSLVDDAIAEYFGLSMRMVRILGERREKKAAAARTK